MLTEVLLKYLAKKALSFEPKLRSLVDKNDYSSTIELGRISGYIECLTDIKAFIQAHGGDNQ